MIRPRTLPAHLHAAYEWTRAAGEVYTLRTLTGESLDRYCQESAANAAEHGAHDVTTDALHALAEWCRAELAKP